MNCLRYFLVFFLMYVICPERAFAYLDPGTGSMIVQALIAGFVGFACTFKVWYSKLLDLFRKNKKDETNGN